MSQSGESSRQLPMSPVDDYTEIGLSIGATLRLAARAMACDFGAIVNAGETEHLLRCGEALELIPEIESWLSVYRDDSELSQLNRCDAHRFLAASDALFDLLRMAADLHNRTDGAFDMASGSQIALWRQCRSENRIPTDQEIERAVSASGMSRIRLNEAARKVMFVVDTISFDAGAIGKGYALDQACSWLDEQDHGPRDFILHGGHSSLLARGSHNRLAGWPVGIGNPLLTRRRLGTLILKNQAMSTSGSNTQFYRCQGRRFGHILDPRTGWPVDGMLSVTVLADCAAVADAVSTAFFVLGVEKAVACCDNLPEVGAVLIPFPRKGARVRPTVVGIPPEQICWDEDWVVLT